MPSLGFPLGLAFGSTVVTTISAEAIKPIAVPENSQWKLITVSNAEARIGLVRLSMS